MHSKHRTHCSIVTIVPKSWELSPEKSLSVKVLPVTEEMILSLFLRLLLCSSFNSLSSYWGVFYFSQALWLFLFPLTVLTISAHPQRDLSWEESQSKQDFVSHCAFSPSWETPDPNRPLGIHGDLNSPLAFPTVVPGLPAFHKVFSYNSV